MTNASDSYKFCTVAPACRRRERRSRRERRVVGVPYADPTVPISDPLLLLRLLLLLGVANGTPVFGTRLLRGHLATPLDGGLTLPDGRPLFGPSKTIRGAVLAIGCTSLVAPLLGMPWRLGADLATASMIGDLLSSFIKRRLGLPPHARAFGLDQALEALLPLLLVRARVGLSVPDIVLVLATFMALEVVLSRWLFRLGVRDRPY